MDHYCILFGVVSLMHILLAEVIANSDQWEEDVADVLLGLGWEKGVRFMHSQTNDTTVSHIKNLAKFASQKDVLVIFGDQDIVNRRHHQILPVVSYSDSVDDLPDFLDILLHGEYPTEGLLLLTNYSSAILKETPAGNLGSSRAFFHHQIGEGSLSIRRLQTFREGEGSVVQMEFLRAGASGRFDRVYDFQGSKFTIITNMNEYPWLYAVPHPQIPSLAVYSIGTDIDSAEVLMQMFNFTLEVRIQVDNNWGITPETGEVGDPSATYGGIYGAVLAGEYDRASTGFIINLARWPQFDFSVEFIYIKTHYMMDVARATEADWTLYLRPISPSAWSGCIIMSLVVCSSYLLAHCTMRMFLKTDKETEGVKIVVFLGWMCFMVFETYYEGALTMFFTTEGKLPFSTIEEGLSLYPDYKLVIRAGTENLVHQGVLAGIAGMDDQLDRMRDDPDILQPNVMEQLNSLKTPGRFIVAYPPEIRAALAMNPIEGLTLQTLFPSKTNNGFYAALYPKRSPWKAAFDIGYQKMVSTGQVEHFEKRRLPREPESSKLDKEQLDVRQTSLAFVLFGSLVTVAVLMLGMEISLKGRGRGIGL